MKGGAPAPARARPRDPVRRRARSLAACAFVAAAVLPWPARAERPERRLELLVGGAHLDYVERGPTGAFLDGERGWLPALSASAEWRPARAFLSAAAGASRGAVSYRGRVQSSSPDLDDLPARTTSAARFLFGEVRLGAWLDRRRAFALWAGGAARRWDRDIRSASVTSRAGSEVEVAGLSEEYRWLELQAGVRWAFAPGPRSECEVELAAVRTVSPSMAVRWGSAEETLDLGARTGGRVAATVRRTLGSGAFLSLAGSAEWYRFGASGVDATTRLLEPASETWNLGLRAGAGARF